MSFQIALDKYERAYGALVRAVQAALQSTFAEEANDRGLMQADLSRELDISPGVISRKLNGSGNSTLRSISDLFTAMGRELPQDPVPHYNNEKPQPLLGNRINIKQLAVELNPDKPPCERSVYNLLGQLQVPYVKILGVRWYDRDVVREAILAREVNRQLPKRGRRTIR